jgi:PKD repeat protein
MPSRRTTSFLVLAALMFAGACGGGGDGAPPPPAPPPNATPVASFTATPSSGTAPLEVQFDASASSDSDGSIASYAWHFGDGSASGSGVTASHVFQMASTLTVTVTVTDDRGFTNSTTRQVVVQTAPPPPVAVTIQEPAAGGPVPDQVWVAVSVRSTYEISSVVATLAGRQTPLAYTFEAFQCAPGWKCPGYAAALSLASQPTGSYPLNVRATDVRGNVGEASSTVVHDNPPRLTVAQPLDLSVALPTLPLDARCSDDLPGCTVELRINGSPVQSAPGALTGPIDLSSLLGTTVELLLRARDSSGQLASAERTIFAEDSTRLRAVAEVPGAILDADATRLLFVVPGPGGDVLAIHDRGTGLTETIPLPAQRDVFEEAAFLTPSGAMVVSTQSGGSSLTARLHLWRYGILSDLGRPDGLDSLVVSGAHAIWNDGKDLYRLNAVSGASTRVSSEAGNWSNSVANDGTVAFWTTAHQIVRDKSGHQTALTSDASRWHVWPVTDGNNVVYRRTDTARREHAIVLIAGTTSIVLAAERDVEPLSGNDYQINAGWAAYTDLGAQEQLHVFTRSPQGTVTRHTDLAASSRIDGLDPNGEVMLVSRRQRYFSRGTGLVPISSSSGESYWLDGAWYVAIGRALLTVDTGR